MLAACARQLQTANEAAHPLACSLKQPCWEDFIDVPPVSLSAHKRVFFAAVTSALNGDELAHSECVRPCANFASVCA